MKPLMMFLSAQAEALSDSQDDLFADLLPDSRAVCPPWRDDESCEEPLSHSLRFQPSAALSVPFKMPSSAPAR